MPKSTNIERQLKLDTYDKPMDTIPYGKRFMDSKVPEDASKLPDVRMHMKILPKDAQEPSVGGVRG